MTQDRILKGEVSFDRAIEEVIQNLPKFDENEIFSLLDPTDIDDLIQLYLKDKMTPQEKTDMLGEFLTMEYSELTEGRYDYRSAIEFRIKKFIADFQEEDVLHTSREVSDEEWENVFFDQMLRGRELREEFGRY